jgi:hypothetical protein
LNIWVHPWSSLVNAVHEKLRQDSSFRGLSFGTT